MLPERKNWVFMVSLLFVILCSLLATDISNMLQTLVTKTILFQDWQNIESILNMVEAVSVLFWGIVVDRFPLQRKKILFSSAAIWIASGVIFLIVPVSQVTVGLLLWINVAWGVAIGANGPIIASYLGDLFHIGARGRLFAIFTTGLYFVKAIAYVGDGFIGFAVNSWTLPISIFALLGIGAVIIFMKFAPTPRFGGAEPELENTEYAFHFRPSELRPILEKRTNILFMLQGISGMAGVTIVTNYMLLWFTAEPTSAPDALHLDPYLAAIILGAGGAIGALCGIFLAGLLADRAYKSGRINRVLHLAIASLFLEVIAYAVVILIPDYPKNVNLTVNDVEQFFTGYPIFIAFLVGFNIATFFSTPTGTTIGIVRTHVNLPEHRGTVSSLYDFTTYIGSGIGFFVGSIIFALVHSYRFTIVFGATFWLISGVIWALVLLTVKKDFASVRSTLQIRGEELRVRNNLQKSDILD